MMPTNVTDTPSNVTDTVGTIVGARSTNAFSTRVRLQLLCILLILTFLSQHSQALSLVSRLDRSTIHINETVRLIVSADENVSGSIDFSQLNRQFNVLQNSRSSQTRIINGKQSNLAQWNLTLQPKQTGTLLIPSFKLNGAISNAQQLEVLPPQKINSRNLSQQDVFLQVSTDKRQAYVQEQIILTIELFYKIALSRYVPQDLQINNASLEKISENNYQKAMGNQRFNVLELKYALHSQRSGTLEIPQQVWQLQKSSPRFAFGGIGAGGDTIAVTSPAKSISILPIPDGNTAQHWLPSTRVHLETDWKNSVVNSKIGEPLTLSVTLEGHGVLGSQLPEITLPESDDYTVYQDQPNTQTQTTTTGVVGSVTTEFAVIPKSLGSITFPAIEVPWWNVKTQREEIATIPSRTLVVSNSTLNNGDSPFLKQEPKISQALVADNNSLTDDGSKSVLLWQLLCGALAFISLIMLMLLVFRKPKTHPSDDQETRNQKRQESRSSLLKSIDNSLQTQDFKTTRRYIIQWAQVVCDDDSVQTLNHVSQHFPQLNNMLKTLDAQLFGTNSDVTWTHGPNLLSALKAIKNMPNSKSNSLYLKHLYQ